MAEPIFIEANLDTIYKEMVTDYETRVGKTLQPAQPEALLLRTLAFREYILRQQGQQAGLSQLVDFSTAPVLDYLGVLVGAIRLPAAPAVCTIRFELVDGHGDLTIPQGTRVSSSDGVVVFSTLDPVDVEAADNTVDIECECAVTGLVGNGYVAGAIRTILDPQAYFDTAANLDTTSAGSDTETDEQLRARIKLAPSTFSTAGPKPAYKFWTRSVSSSIIDVEVITPAPGTVAVYPLIAGGVVTPDVILNEVYDALMDEDIHVICDTVQVISPTVVNYSLNIDLIRLPDAIQQDIIDQVTANLTAFTQARLKKLGGDVVAASIIANCMVPGVYKPVITGFTDLVISNTQVAKCTSITVTSTSVNNG